jgi:hypothetical protein
MLNESNNRYSVQCRYNLAERIEASFFYEDTPDQEKVTNEAIGYGSSKPDGPISLW